MRHAVCGRQVGRGQLPRAIGCLGKVIQGAVSGCAIYSLYGIVFFLGGVNMKNDCLLYDMILSYWQDICEQPEAKIMRFAKGGKIGFRTGVVIAQSGVVRRGDCLVLSVNNKQMSSFLHRVNDMVQARLLKNDFDEYIAYMTHISTELEPAGARIEEGVDVVERYVFEFVAYPEF